MSAEKLREQILPRYEYEILRDYRLVRILVDGEVVGHVFGCYWAFDGGGICWVTQLVVKKRWRGRGIAKRLLASLKERGVGWYGILSSSAFAVCAAWRVLGGSGKLFVLSYHLGRYSRGVGGRECVVWPLKC